MPSNKETPDVEIVVLKKWNFNPKTQNIISGTGYPPHPIYGDYRRSLSLFKIVKNTEIAPHTWKTWFNHRPIVVSYDKRSANNERVLFAAITYKALRIEPLRKSTKIK